VADRPNTHLLRGWQTQHAFAVCLSDPTRICCVAVRPNTHLLRSCQTQHAFAVWLSDPTRICYVAVRPNTHLLRGWQTQHPLATWLTDPTSVSYVADRPNTHLLRGWQTQHAFATWLTDPTSVSYVAVRPNTHSSWCFLLTFIIAVGWRARDELCGDDEKAESHCATLDSRKTLHVASAKIKHLIVTLQYMEHNSSVWNIRLSKQMLAC
jgi:hypothetical protein